jgi:transposase-like protein DUF772
MRAKDEQQLDVFTTSVPSREFRRTIRYVCCEAMSDEALQQLQLRFNRLYAKTGQPSIAPAKLLRALLLQALYSVRSERMLMEQLDYNLLSRVCGLRNACQCDEVGFSRGVTNIA